jgi:predicted amidohydrolase YtcJ
MKRRMWKFLLRIALCGLTASGADLVLRNGKIVTLDPANPQATGIAVTGGKIVAVGSDAQVAKEIQSRTRVIDLAGRLAAPGFIEGHGHFMAIGQSKTELDLTSARTWDEIVAMVAAAAKQAKPGEWILGRGWHQEKWDAKPVPEVRGFPVHASLTKVSPNNPVLLEHVSGHAVFVNGAALTRTRISGTTPAPTGGEILKDASGNPTGLLNEGAQSLANDALQRDLARRSAAEQNAQAEKELDLAAQECLSKGITSFEDAGSSPDVIERFRKRAEKGALPLRLWVMLRASNGDFRAWIAAHPSRMLELADNHLTVRAIKEYMDGALGSRGAWLLEPYADLPSSSGLNIQSVAEIEETSRIAIANGYQLAVHAIGDRANLEVLNLYERVFSANPGKTDLRWRIEHAQHLNPADIPRFAQLGVIAAMQGIHATSDGLMVIPRLGPKRAEEGAYVWRSLLNTGAHIANGTDAPVEDVSPIQCFYASVTRRMKNGETFYPAQKMTRIEALRSYTVENAYAAFEENLKGALKPGMLGDITVLSKDILTIPDDQLLSTQVDYTIVGGKIKYERIK